MELNQIEIDLKTLSTDQKSFIFKAQEEIKNVGNVSKETREALDRVIVELKAVQTQADAIDQKINEGKLGQIFGDENATKTMGEQFVDSNIYKDAKAENFLALRKKEGRIAVPFKEPFAGRKSVISTSAGLTQGTTGIQMPMRLPGVTILAQQFLRIRDLLTVRTMSTGNSFDFVQQLTRSTAASPQVEATTKAESTYTWNSLSGTIKTIAHFTNVSRQALDDVPWLQQMLNSELMYGLLLKEEQQILSGDGTGQNLNGLLTQATAYNTGLYNVSADQKMDVLRHAKLQARLAGLGTFAPDGYVLNPVDLEKIELIKDETGGANKGRYIVGDPKSGTQVMMLWGLPVVESDSIPSGTFLVGSFGVGAELVDRMEAMIEISYETGNNFTQNLATILCEERVGLAVRRPGAFVTGGY
jgi:HK97 family phage major capsid protein